MLWSTINSKLIGKSSRIRQQLPALGMIEDWAGRWRLSINPAKMVAVRFTRRRTVPDSRIVFGDEIILWSKAVRHLWITLDGRLRFLPHVRNTSIRFWTAKTYLCH